MGVLMLICLALNVVGINVVAILNQVSVWWHIAIVAAIVILVFVAGKPDMSGLTLFAIQPQDTAGSWANDLTPLGHTGQPELRSGHHVSALPGLHVLAAAGQLDLHRL